MRVCVIGSGYVGLVTAACLADSGNHVVGVDIDERKVRQLNEGVPTIFERGLEDLLRANLADRRLRFTTSLKDGVSRAQVVFICVGTPPRADGSPDLTQVETVAAQVGDALDAPAVVVMKSTVPVGTCDRVEAVIRAKTKHAFHVVSNPEFLKEGAAVDDFLRPDRVVVGANDDAAGDLVSELYAPYVRNAKPIVRMKRLAAEMTKYAANSYLATRISFINEVAEMCEKLGVDVDEVRRGIGLDARIGMHFMYPGVGYGGSCFPKDVQALAHTARAAGVDCRILDAVHERNQAQRYNFVTRILKRFGGDLRGRKLALWGVAFKPNTDDIREAPAITAIEELLKAGAAIAVHDPKAIEHTRQIFGDRVEYCTDAYAALQDADALVAMTEWMEYRSPDFDVIRAALKQPLIFDGRNIYTRDTMARWRFEYHSIGRPPVLEQDWKS